MNNNELQFIFAIFPESKKYCSDLRQVFWLVRFSEPSHPETIGTVAFDQKPLTDLQLRVQLRILTGFPFHYSSPIWDR
jgi:hypothetical protein